MRTNTVFNRSTGTAIATKCVRPHPDFILCRCFLFHTVITSASVPILCLGGVHPIIWSTTCSFGRGTFTGFVCSFHHCTIASLRDLKSRKKIWQLKYFGLNLGFPFSWFSAIGIAKPIPGWQQVVVDLWSVLSALQCPVGVHQPAARWSGRLAQLQLGWAARQQCCTMYLKNATVHKILVWRSLTKLITLTWIWWVAKNAFYS